MFTRLKKIFSSKEPKDGSQPLKIVPQGQHTIDHNLISRNALTVVTRLQECGYEAYLVGGCIRDLLLNGKPKDFDVATSAKPEQVKRIFNNAMIIGRRFRIVHVRYGREVIEVTTFRAHHEQSNNRRESEKSNTGMLLRDNVYGDIESDALRRDFTINALYYNPSNKEILDYADGLEDLNKREIRIIGDAAERYREDPVRMLRALRFSAKLGFNIQSSTADPISRLADQIRNVSSARMFDEVLKLLLNGSATATFELLRDYQLFTHLFPATDAVISKDDQALKMVVQAMVNTDKRIRQNKRVTPAFIFAVFLWSPLQKAIEQLLSEQRISTQEAMQQAAHGLIGQQLVCTAIPKRFLIPMREIWSLQLRLPKRESKRVYAVLEHARFRAAYDFLLLREESGEKLDGLGQWWTRFQDADKEVQEAMIKECQGTSRRRRRPRRRKQSAPKE